MRSRSCREGISPFPTLPAASGPAADIIGIPDLGQKRSIAFPDLSHATALIWLGEDHIDLLEGHHPRPDWMNQPPGKVMVFAHNPPANLAFDRITAQP